MIYGMHDPFPRDLMPKGTILITIEVGHDPNNHSGQDFREWSEHGVRVIARLNNGYGAAGTIPSQEHYLGFAERCAWFVRNSQGCTRWIIGNEPNHSNEWPQGNPITAEDYVYCFTVCRDLIKAMRPDHEVIPAPVAPWNVQVGDWLVYFDRLMAMDIDAIALHTYTYGAEPGLITSEATMDPPYQDRRFHFRAYQDFMNRIPESKRHLPVYITETDQDDAWLNWNNGWVRKAYKEIDDWNHSGRQVIHCLCLYRWPKLDKWAIDGKSGVQDDFREAQAFGYQVGEPEPPEPPEPPPQEDNMLLKNGSFEGEYTARGAPQVLVAQGWEPFYKDNEPAPGEQGPAYRPEYKPLEKYVDPYRIRDGDRAQCWFKQFAIMDAGVYQRVTGVPIGATVRFVAPVHAWCSGKDDPKVSDGEMYVKVGIDLDGGEDPWSDAVIWHDANWQYVGREWQEIGIAGIARGTAVTVFIRAWNKWKLKHNDFYVDACTMVVEGGEPIPDPDPDPVPLPEGSYVAVDDLTFDGPMHIVPLEAGSSFGAAAEGVYRFVGPSQRVVLVDAKHLSHAVIEPPK